MGLRRVRWLAPGFACVALLALLLTSSAGASTPPTAAPSVVAKPKPIGAPRGLSVRAAQSGALLQITQQLTLSTLVGKVAEPMYATARVKNVGTAPITVAWLGASGRGPNVPDWDCGTIDWAYCGADFEALENVTIQPGEEVAYYQPRLPVIRGDYWTTMVYQDAATGSWAGVVGSDKISYRVVGGELAVVQPLVVSPMNPWPGQAVTATARVKNVGDAAASVRYLTAAGRGPGCADWGCADDDNTLVADFSRVEDLVLQPGQEYQYYGLSSGRRSGPYFAEMAYEHAGTDVWRFGIGGANRVQYATSCDARCAMITSAYADVLGQVPQPDDLRVAYDSGFGDQQLRGYLCGLPDHKASACGGAAVSPLVRIAAFLPSLRRLAG